MASASHQSKQKQQTSKKDSQAEKTNGKAVSNETVVSLSLEQARIFAELIEANNNTQAQLNFALAAAGLSPSTIIGGNLEGDSPHFVIKTEPQN